MSAFHIWRDDPPPRSTFVWARYRLAEKWHLVKTCRRGCCVYDGMGTLILPRFWREATEVEAAQEQAVWNAMKPIDLTELYQ